MFEIDDELTSFAIVIYFIYLFFFSSWAAEALPSQGWNGWESS